MAATPIYTRTFQGRTYRMWIDEEREAYAEAVASFVATAPPEELNEEDLADRTQQELSELGIIVDPLEDVRGFLEQSGVDVEDPGMLGFLEAIKQMDDKQAADAMLQASLPQLQEQYPSTPQTAYSGALKLSGFDGKGFFEEQMTPGGYQTGAAQAMIQGQGTGTEAKRFETHPETGWVRYSTGVLVNPEAGGPQYAEAIFFEPGTDAPGSPWWLRSVVPEWSAKKVSEWKARLAKFGYLTKEQAKTKDIDQMFLQGLQDYHRARYFYGQPTPGDAAAASGADGGDQPKIFDLNEIRSTIRNDVREQYRRVYGTEPSDGEVQTWAEYIISKANQQQRENIRRYDSPMTESASTEAGERFVERLERSPEAQFLRESEEENTRLRETFDRMAAVTNSLIT